MKLAQLDRKQWLLLEGRRPQSLFLKKAREQIDKSPFQTNNLTGTDQSQGKGQVISNINACLAVQGTIKTTLGPYGGDLLLVDGNGKQTITNDGATVMKVRSEHFHHNVRPPNLLHSYSTSSTQPRES